MKASAVGRRAVLSLCSLYQEGWMEPEALGNRKSGLIRRPALAGSMYRANRSNTHRPILLTVSEKTLRYQRMEI